MFGKIATPSIGWILLIGKENQNTGKILEDRKPKTGLGSSHKINRKHFLSKRYTFLFIRNLAQGLTLKVLYFWTSFGHVVELSSLIVPYF